jgi:hypothetical protein
VLYLFLRGVACRPFALGVLWLSLAMYGVAFAAPYDQGWSGWQIFLVGLLYCWVVHLTFAWWSNVVYWVAVVYFCRGQWSGAARSGLFATALGSAWALWHPRQLFASSAFLLWIGSMAVLGAGSLVLAKWKRAAFPISG